MHKMKTIIYFYVCVYIFLCIMSIPAQGCKTIEDCSLNGECNNGNCICEPAWIGEDCGILNLLPTPNDAGLNVNLSSTWGGGVIQDSQNIRCILHVQSLWARYMDPELHHRPCYIQGPLRVAPDGTFLIFHIGCSDEPAGNLKNCTNGTYSESSKEFFDIRKENVYGCNNFAVRALSSKSLEGPWTDNALFSPVSGQDWPKSTDNPSAYFYPNGSIVVLFRSWYVTPNGTVQSWIGAASANSWLGPYHVPTAPLFYTNQEDPFIWRDVATGYFHALFHTQVDGACGRHAYSIDGSNWTLSSTPAYNQSVQFEDGTSWWFQRRERPQLHFDSNGRPVVLYNGVQPNANDRTYTLATPIFSGQ